MSFFNGLLDKGYKGSIVLFFTVISYKIYKMKISTESNCFHGCFKLTTHNDGGPDLEGV